MPVIRDTVIQFLQQIKGFGESVRQAREPGATMPRLPLTPGAEVLATVTGKLENGMSLVRISSSTFAMDLPAGAKTGDTLRMTFLNQDPRPMFSLSNRTFSAAPVTMSPAGELVRRLLRNPAQDSSARSPLPVMGRLLDAPPGDTTRLAGRLRQALGESGLFYESHLEEWAAGERPMARVMREPQAALSRPEARARAAAMTATDRPSSGAAVQDGEMSGVPTEDGVAEEIPRPPGGSRSSEAGQKETGRTPVATERREGAPTQRDEGGRSAREVAPERREASGGPAGEPGRRVPGDGFPDSGTGTRTPSRSAQQGEQLPKEAAPGPDSRLTKSQPTDSGSGARPADAPAKETGRTPVETERREGAVRRDEGGRPVRDAGPERRESSGGTSGETGRSLPGERPTNPSPVREPAADVRGESGRPVMAEAETGPRPGPDPGRTPSALVEQRERLLKETYGRMEDYAVPEKQSPREPVRGPLPGSERAPEFSRTVFPGQDRDVGAEVSRNVATGDLARVEEHEPSELPPSRIAGQGEIADARTLPLVSRQLNMLNSGLFVWQGEAWPGQTMDWEVEDREANPETGDENGWRTTLRLDLPNLGRVTGVINLSGNELLLSLATDSPESASLMDVGLGELRERMGNAGIEVKGVAVRHEELEGT